MFSLKKVTWLGFVVVALLLALIITLGVRQKLLSDSHSGVIEQSESVIFHFVTVREMITEALIDKNWKQLELAIPEIEHLNTELLRLQEHSLTPPEVRVAMVDRVDLKGIVITLKRIARSRNPELEQGKTLQDQMRTLSDNLLQYNRIIVNQARKGILDFQLVIIGTLGIIISLATFALILLYRNSVVPLLSLSTRLRDTGELPDDYLNENSVSREVFELFEAIRLRDGAGEEVAGHAQELAILAETINETTNQLNGMINYAQILYDDERVQLTDEEKELLLKIIESGSAIAQKWQNINKEK